MDKIELVQKIGEEVCEDCGPDSDCGIIPSDCDRIKSSLELLDEYLSNKQNPADAECDHDWQFHPMKPGGFTACTKCHVRR